MSFRTFLHAWVAVTAAWALSPAAAARAAELSQFADMVLDPDALLMPASATYGRAINGVSFQTESLLTVGGYQYATWYHRSGNEDVYVGRRALGGTTWEILDTGQTMINGDGPAWDAHNVISMGIAGDGSIHLVWDLHGHTLRYMDAAAGAATGATWDSSLFNSERSSLNPGGGAIGGVTYPRFVTDPATGDMLLTYRTGGSGGGNIQFATRDDSTGLWDAPHEIINGTDTGYFYDDPYGGGSNNRNAYLNGIDIDSTGRLHTTWTWRESATGSSNHDIAYAYSDDGGASWRNNDGAVVGTVGNPIDYGSPGITVVPMDRGNTLMNQQTQAVDQDGRVHAIMWHKTDEAAPVTGFTTAPAAYFHYVRDPATGVWSRNDLPAERAVGSRPDMAYDEHGNLYAAYVAPGVGDPGGYYTSGDLVIAAASKATGYADWQIVATDTRDFAGEPFIDQQRLLAGGVVSVIIQENDAAQTGVTGTPLRVIEWNKLANLVVWAGDDSGAWNVGGGTDWDNDNDDVGDAPFADGYRASFDDGATTFAVNIAAPVAPAATEFRNTAAHAYALTGAGIAGGGGLTVAGGGAVTLANGANTYAGATEIASGSLHLAGAATIAASPLIAVRSGAVLNASGTTSGGLVLNAQTAVIEGQLTGDIAAASGSSVELAADNGILGNVSLQLGSTLSGVGSVNGNLTAASGSLVRVGGAGLSSALQPVVTLVDNFDDGDVSQYVATIVNDQNASANIAFDGSTGGLQANYSGDDGYEQAVFLRDDVELAVGESLRADLNMTPTGLQMDFGLAISATATPAGVGGGDSDTRDEFDWASVSMRPSQNNIRVNQSADGSVDTTSGAIGSVSELTVTGLFITRISDTQYAVGYTDDNLVSHVARTMTFTAADVGSAVGFYADVRSAGSLGAFDDLRILSVAETFAGETLTATGDVALSADSTLALDIADAGIGDRLIVGGELLAGGALEVSLTAGAGPLALGDVFDLLDFASASGGFGAFDLPALDAGLAWNISKLLDTGELEVVVDVDLNNDGMVDGSDFLAIQRTDPSLAAAWRDNYGSRLVTPGSAGTGRAAGVPEPAAMVLLSGSSILYILSRTWQAASRRFCFLTHSPRRLP